ncbi:MAG: 50S ribosomal protein L9 [Lentisphaeria bacterium]|jgi:large subunit ribosomal protein L9
MATEVLLIANVASLGKIGDVVKVSDGYARNFLLPQKLATNVTAAALRTIESRKAKAAAEEATQRESCKSQAEVIGKLTLTLTAKAGDDDRLYGSISAGQIADALAAQKITVAKTAILLAEPIKALGDYTATVKLHPEVQASLKLRIVRR